MRKFFTFFTFTMFALVGCSNNNGSPVFTSKDTPFTQGGTENSVVNELLAKEAGIQHLIYHVGPVDLPAHTDFETSLARPLTMKFQVDQPIWVIGFEPKVINAAGEALPSDLLFEAVISNAHEENPLCAEGTVGNPFIAATAALTKIKLPDGYGYPILPTDPLEAKVILHNPTDESYIDTSFEVDITAKPMNEFTGLKDIKPILLDVDPCTHQPIQIEPEKFVERKATFAMPSNGNLVVSHGILQNYGSYAELYKKEETAPFWRAEAVLGESYNITSLTNNPFEDPEGIKFKMGDTITLGVAYDNPQKVWFKGATAAAMIYFAPEE